ncbi:MAG: pyruvate kinase [Clostridiales bacterium]|nr:MAG: pyruvate kinase [Clostridiales bacterium]
MRKTKIVCTLGPASNTPEKLRSLILAGMDVARFNFSHSTHEQHKALFDTFVKVRDEIGKPVPTLLDTKGPEIRLKKFKNGSAELNSGDKFILTTDDVEGDNTRCSITYEGLPGDVAIDSRILIDDGLIELKVEKITPKDIFCRVINGGIISDKKGINVPDVRLSLPFISAQDKSDIIFGIKTGFDFIAASFTRSAQDIVEIREILESENNHDIKIIAKIENMEGVRNADEIIRVADGIMVARGDLGVEIPLEDIPVIQKKLIQKVYKAGKQSITATQMLDSMIKNPRPTRAEATDVANAIYDGTSAIMLSGETAMGAYPLEAVTTMARIAERTESDIDYAKILRGRTFPEGFDVTNAISHATCTTAHDLNAAAIITVTKSGQTAKEISKFRPQSPIIAFTPSNRVCRQMNMSWGVIPLTLDEVDNTDDLFSNSVEKAQNAGLLHSGDLVVITAGVPLKISGTTNLLKVHIVGKILVSGNGVNKDSVCAKLCVCKTEKEVFEKFEDGDILVVPQTSNAIMDVLRRASGIVTEQDGLNSHAAIVGLTLDIPVIVGASNATQILKSGVTVNLDGTSATVCSVSAERK